MKQIKKNYGKKPTTAVSKQSTNGNKGNALRNRYTEKFIRPTEFPARSGRMTYIRKDYHHIIANMIPLISDGIWHSDRRDVFGKAANIYER